jgi:DNA-binding Lrp family transcriptional regulator
MRRAGRNGGGPTLATAKLDELDRRLLNRVQEDFPLAPTPYAALGAALGTPEADVLDRIARLRDAHIIRQISAIFDTRALGYHSTLVAMRFAPERLEAGAALISAHPGVSHNYARKHEYNLWFTLAVPPWQDVAEAAEALGRRAGAEATRVLPTLRLFKIGVKLDVAGERTPEAREAGRVYAAADVERGKAAPLSARDIAVIRELQKDLPLQPRPFDGYAAALGCTLPDLFAWCARMMACGKMRRFAAVLRHQNAGFVSNAMGVWKVPSERVAEVGPQMASFAAVSHCYERPVYPDFPYNLYTMVHGRTREECLQTLEAIAAQTGVAERQYLWSSREFKKERVLYFLEEDLPPALAHA